MFIMKRKFVGVLSNLSTLLIKENSIKYLTFKIPRIIIVPDIR